MSLIKIKSETKSGILESMPTPKHKQAMKFLLELVDFNDFKNNFIDRCYLNFQDYYDKLKTIKAKKSNKNLLESCVFFSNYSVMKPLLDNKYLDILSIIALIDLKNYDYDCNVFLCNIEKDLNYKLNDSELKELIFLSFKNVDPFNLHKQVEDGVFRLNKDIKVTPYLINKIYKVFYSFSLKNELFIDDETLERLSKNNPSFFNIADIFSYTEKQIRSIYLDYLDDSDFYEKITLKCDMCHSKKIIAFLENNKRFKALANYEKAKQLAEIINIPKNKFADFLWTPEKFMRFQNMDTIIELKNHSDLIKDAFKHEKQRFNIFMTTGITTIMDYRYKDISITAEHSFYYGLLCSMDNDNFADFINFLIQNHKYDIIANLYYLSSKFSEKQKIIFQICKQNDLNINYYMERGFLGK